MLQKNVHIIASDKPSRIIFNMFHNSFCIQKENDWMFVNDGKVNGANFWSIEKAQNNGFLPQHIYITSDEKIKEGDWVYHKVLKSVFKIDLKEVSQEYVEERKNIQKIILTTDQDLIKDGVQAIDDTFLEWFVQNPSCKRVEIGTYHIKGDISGKLHYKIIIPQEEPKQEDFEYVSIGEERIKIPIQEPEQELPHYKIIIPQEEPDYTALLQPVGTRQETLEEAAENYSIYNEQINKAIQEAVKFGAKWQAERMYNEEDIAIAFNEGQAYSVTGKLVDGKDWIKTHKREWFKQHKK